MISNVWQSLYICTYTSVFTTLSQSGSSVERVHISETSHYAVSQSSMKSSVSHTQMTCWLKCPFFRFFDPGGKCRLSMETENTSQMSVVKVMDVIARLPDCAGQVADAVSAYTQVLMKDARMSKLYIYIYFFFFFKRIPLSRHKWPKALTNIEDPVVRNLHDHPLQVLLGLEWKKVPNWECLSVHRKSGLFLSIYVDDNEITGEYDSHKKDIDVKEWYLRIMFIYWSRTLDRYQRECKPHELIIKEYREIFESRISVAVTKNCLETTFLQIPRLAT